MKTVLVTWFLLTPTIGSDMGQMKFFTESDCMEHAADILEKTSGVGAKCMTPEQVNLDVRWLIKQEPKS